MFTSLRIVALLSAVSVGLFLVFVYWESRTGFPAVMLFPAVIIPFDYFLIYVSQKIALRQKMMDSCSEIQSILQEAKRGSYAS